MSGNAGAGQVVLGRLVDEHLLAERQVVREAEHGPLGQAFVANVDEPDDVTPHAGAVVGDQAAELGHVVHVAGFLDAGLEAAEQHGAPAASARPLPLSELHHPAADGAEPAEVVQPHLAAANADRAAAQSDAGIGVVERHARRAIDLAGVAGQTDVGPIVESHVVAGGRFERDVRNQLAERAGRPVVPGRGRAAAEQGDPPPGGPCLRNGDRMPSPGGRAVR